jgi:hypothetical protein
MIGSSTARKPAMAQRSRTFAKSAIALAVCGLVAACGGGESVEDPRVAPDGAAPTLIIEDNVAGARATGAVTFTFTFSESVGATFTIGDVNVSGGSAGSLIKVNDRKYLVEVTPPADSTGMVRVAVAAGSYADLGGIASTTSNMQEQAFDTVRPPPPGGDVTLASFDEPTALEFVGFNGAETSTIAAGPAGGSGNAGRIIRLGGEVWAGAKVNVGPIALTATNRTISARVHSPAAGVRMVLKLEASDPNRNTGDLESRETVVAGWQTLTWLVPADKVATDYIWVVMLPNLGTRANDNPGETYHFDDIKLVRPAAGTTLSSFDEPTPLEFVGFNGAETSTIAAGPAGGSGNAGKIIRLGGEVWAGAKVNVGPIALASGRRIVSARVNSPAAGVRMVLKLEASDPNVNTGDLEARETVVAGWQTLTWLVPADKVVGSYIWVVMLPNLGTRANDNPGETYWFDDIKLESGP